MKSALIQISEAQRAALHAVLEPMEKRGELPPALEFWPAMLAQLPRDEAENPGCVNGFCL